MDNAQIIRNAVRERAQIITGLNRSVWEYAELGYQETKSAAAIIKALEDDGFTVTKELAGIPTAFKAVWGSGSPVVGILGEYDALPGLSQKAGVAAPEPDEGHTTGHGCGHCALGAGAVGAAMAAKAYLEQSKKPGTLVFFGCPAEEQGFGKGFMAKARCFDGVDMMFTWHPADQNVPMGTRMVANYKVRFDFTGISAHAGAAPEKGRSALDACELMNVGVNYMREHVISDARIHYAYLDNGGEAPNVVQDHASLLYFMRAPKLAQSSEILARIKKIAQGAALMTETEVKVRVLGGLSDVIPNPTAFQVLSDAYVEMGGPEFDEEDYAIARKFLAILPEDAKKAMVQKMAVLHKITPEEFEKRPLNSVVIPYSPLLYGLVGLGIAYIILFCLITLKKAYKHALELGITKEKLKLVITSSAIYSVVPSISIVIGLFSLASVLGVPWSWFRLSVVGSVTYELMAADMVATGTGYESVAALNAAGDASVVGTVMFVMSICIMGGLIAILLFGKRIQMGLTKARSKHGELGALITGVLSLAIIEAFLPMQLMKGKVHLAVVFTSCIIVLIHLQIIKRFKCLWLRNFVMANTLLLGMASSLVWIRILG